jgi:hypothetical protein
MKRMYTCLLVIGLNLMARPIPAQSNHPPSAIADVFVKMFPTAAKVDWKEKTTNFTAFFDLNDRKCEAKFAKSGEWLNTEETMQWDSLPQPIKDGFKSSKYADWKETSAFSVQSSDGTMQYHVVATSTDMGRKILFFSQGGKLLSDH